MYETIDSILRWSDLSRDLSDSLGDDASREFEAFVARVEGRFESSPNFPAVRQFIQDHSRLRDDELVRLFEFIYSSLVNNFKGEIAELLARPRLAAYATLLPEADLEIVIGPRLRVRQGGFRAGWYQGADAMFCRRDRHTIEIAAVAEVKAMQRPVPALMRQIANHIQRMRRGLVIDDAAYGPDSITISTSGGQLMPITDLRSIDDVRAVIVRPWISPEGSAIVRDPRRPNVWLAELRYTQDEITEAAYRFVAWYFSRIGPKVFYDPRDAAADPHQRRPAPHPDDSLEENGLNSFIAALYGAWARDLFQPRGSGEPRGGKRSPGDTLLWLYNSMGGGYEQAATDELFYPAFEPDPAYEERLSRRNRALDAFRCGRIVEAIELLPDPTDQKDLWNRRREWLMLARVCVHAGDSVRAANALESAQREPRSTNHAVPFEIAATEALLRRDDLTIDTARSYLEGLREEVREHERNRWAFPADIDVRAVHSGVIDLATAHARRGDHRSAAALLSRMRDVSDDDVRQIENDPALHAVVAEIDRGAWKERTGLARF